MAFVRNQEEALDDSDGLVICTELSEFRRLAVDNFVDAMKHPTIFDGRNIYDLGRARKAGITYNSAGRPVVEAETLKVAAE